MVFPVQHEIASGKKRPRNDSLNRYGETTNSLLQLLCHKTVILDGSTILLAGSC